MTWSLSLDPISSLANNIAPLVLGRCPNGVFSQTIACGQNPLSFNDVAVFYQALTFQQLSNLYAAAVTVPVTPIPIQASLSGSTLTLSWASTGWTLATKTTGLSTPGGWTDVPGSSSVTSWPITISPGSAPVFYRLHNP